MNHATEEQLIMYYYGEPENAAAVEQHLAGCENCRAEYHALQRVLDSVAALPVPERGPGYEAEVWRRVRPRLGGRAVAPVIPFPASRRWLAAGAVAAMVVLAFLAGRYMPTSAPAPVNAGNQVRERILLVAVGDHLDRSQMVLVELSNAQPAPAKKKVDISYEQHAAEDLLESNRLYRQTALKTGDAGVASVLDDLERTLMEVANSPAELDSAQFEELRQRIAAEGILFKVRVIRSRVREQDKAPVRSLGKTSL